MVLQALRHRDRHIRRWIGAGSMIVGLVACGDGGPASRSGDDVGRPPVCAPRSLEVLVFNIEYGGTLVDFGKVVETIDLTGAELVAIEEAYGNLDRLAGELGWSHYDRRTHVLSTLPLVSIQASHGSVLDLVEVRPGCVAAIGNAHLPDAPSGEELRRGGALPEEVVALENRTRMPMLEPMLRDLRELIATDIPTFLAGDFNAPTHLDESFPWPTSLAVEAAGLRDAYRETHPDPQAHPGYTWWAARPRVEGWNPDPNAPQSRIDFLYAGGPARVRDSRLVGETGGRDVDLAIEPWLSDHRAVAATFEVEPFPAPPLVAVPHQRVIEGEDVTVQLHAPGPDSSVHLVAAGERAAAARASRPVPVTAAIQTLALAGTALTPGAWEVVLADGSGDEQVRAPFWVVGRGALPGVASGWPTYAPGDAVTAIWTDTAGNRWDWVGIYRAGAEPERQDPLVWRHTGSTVAGVMQLDGSAEGDGWPLAPGEYRLVLGLDDSYTVLAEASFAVVP
jgi:hypothetical protein